MLPLAIELAAPGSTSGRRGTFSDMHLLQLAKKLQHSVGRRSIFAGLFEKAHQLSLARNVFGAQNNMGFGDAKLFLKGIAIHCPALPLAEGSSPAIMDCRYAPHIQWARLPC